MAVEIFKGDESRLVEPKRLQSHLSMGWSLRPEGVSPPEEVNHALSDEQILSKMGIIPSIDNVIIGATRVHVH